MKTTCRSNSNEETASKKFFFKEEAHKIAALIAGMAKSSVKFIICDTLSLFLLIVYIQAVFSFCTFLQLNG
jgi:hypothetical protein